MNAENNGGGIGGVILAVIVIVVLALVLGPGFVGQSTATRRLEAQAQIATANAQEPLVVASIKDSALVVWYSFRDASRELLLTITVVLLAWRLFASKDKAAQFTVTNNKTEFKDGDSL
jgi:Tfp pilus assembly protein PilE